jgi:hypothetical protein
VSDITGAITGAVSKVLIPLKNPRLQRPQAAGFALDHWPFAGLRAEVAGRARGLKTRQVRLTRFFELNRVGPAAFEVKPCFLRGYPATAAVWGQA